MGRQKRKISRFYSNGEYNVPRTEVDVMSIDGDLELQVIERGTKYSVAKFMKNQTAEHTRDFIVEFWISVCTGSPGEISQDQGETCTADFVQN